MLRQRGSSRSVIVAIALVLLISLAFSTQPSREWIGHNVIKLNEDRMKHKVQVGSRVFKNLDPAKAHIPLTRGEASAICRAHSYRTAPPNPRKKVYDLVLLFNELDWLEVRLHTLAPYVDYFVIVESKNTFTGLPKELYLKNNWSQFSQFHDKIIHYVVEDDLSNDEGSAWDHERFQRNAMLEGAFPTLIGTDKAAQKDDVIIVSDLDEIVRPETATILRYCLMPKGLTLRSRFFYYSYQWQHVGEQWFHPQATTYGGSIDQTLRPDELRSMNLGDKVDNRPFYLKWFQSLETSDTQEYDLWDAAWHCSSCFSTIKEVQDKMAGFSHVEYNTEENRQPATIIERYKNGIDLFDREEEQYEKVDVIDVPPYVMEQYKATGRFGYLIDRTTEYAEFTDAKEMLEERD